MDDIILGCSRWNYPDTRDKGGWTDVFYPGKDINFGTTLNFLIQEKWTLLFMRFYSHMTNGRFIGMTRATPQNFEFSIKVPETITHVKRLDVKKGAMMSFEEFLDKISPLKIAKKLDAILFQLPPSFTVTDFKNIKQFLDRLPTADIYDYAFEFRHPSWGTEGPWEMLKHYNIAAVMRILLQVKISNICQM
jgi:uncharacterized protein YecE (DUF72 family)